MFKFDNSDFWWKFWELNVQVYPFWIIMGICLYHNDIIQKYMIVFFQGTVCHKRNRCEFLCFNAF